MARKDKRRKMAMEEDAAEHRGSSQSASIRAAKKAARPTKIGIPLPQAPKIKSKGPKKTVRKSAFDDKERKGAGSGHEGMRAKQGVGMTKSKGSKTKPAGGKGKPKGKGKR